MPPIVDLRSDTVTRPTAAMRAAIAAADVGDDVLGDDPTVQRLQERVAELFAQEAALFVPSGTMANQLAIRAVCEQGDEVILEENTHSYRYESGGIAALSGASVRFVEGRRGIFGPEVVESAIRPDDPHSARSRMVILENTNNRGGGSVWAPEQVSAIRGVCRQRDLWLHLDGARLMNACVARKLPPKSYTTIVDSVSMCFSKGLGAPVGSILAGGKDFIRRAHRFRKMFGGGMRQAGILAAAALHGLDHHVERLAEDHANARRLAQGLAKLPGVRINAAEVETNIVIYEIEPHLGGAAEFASRLRERGVWLFATGTQSLRAVTHLDVSTSQIDHAVSVCRELTGGR